MKKNLPKFILFFVLLPVCILLIVGGTFAWYCETENKVNSYVSQGSVIKQYFHCGSGTEDDPFVITRPIHYYHLTELYQRSSSFATSGYYFQLGYDIDGDGKYKVYSYDQYGNTDGSTSTELNMAYYSGDLSVIPVGTSNVPFDGHFEGNNLTIKNLSVVSEETITTLSGEKKYGTCDTGIFGYVATAATIKNVYYNNVKISLDGANLSYTCKDGTSGDGPHSNGEIYVGYLVGHLYEFTNAIGRNYYTNTVSLDANPISNVYVNNVTITGGCAQTAKCNFGLIGYIELIDDDPAMTIKNLVDETTSTDQGSEGWGGSILMNEIYNHISTIINASSNYYYNTKETIVASATSNGTSSVTINTQSTSRNRNDDGDTVYYWSPGIQASSTNFTGGTIYGSMASTWTYLYGLTENQTTAVDTWTKNGEQVTAYYILSNGSYLTLDGTTLVGKTLTREACKWVPEDSSASNTMFYTLIDMTKYYLNASVANGVTLSTTGNTRWTIDSEKNEFKTTIGSESYFLTYTGTWEITPTVERIYITDSQGHYLSATSEGVRNVTSSTDGAMWRSQSQGGGTLFFFNSGNRTYYLSYDAGLCISTSGVVWMTEEDNEHNNHMYYTANGIKYYLTYDNGWKAVMTSGYKIYSGTNYLAANSTGIYNTSETNGTLFQIESSSSGYTIVASINGVGKYLSEISGEITYDKNGYQYQWLMLSSSVFYWQKDGYGYYIQRSIGQFQNQKLYLTYKNGWCLDVLNGVLIGTTNEQHYLSFSVGVGSNNNPLLRLGDATKDNARKWMINTSTSTTPIYTIVGTEAYYLYINASGLSFTRDVVQWNKKANNLYAYTYAGDEYYLYYDTDAGWTVKVLTGYKLSDNQGHYIGFRNTAITTVTEAVAPLWQFSNINGSTTTIYYLDGTKKLYLGISGTSLSRSSKSQTWNHTTDGTNKYSCVIDGVTYYLYYKEGTGWTLITLTTQNKLSYTDTTGTYYLHTNGIGLSAVSEENTAATWIVETNGDIYTYVGAVKMYLTYKVSEKLTKVINSDGETYTVTNAERYLEPDVSTSKGNSFWKTETVNSKTYYVLCVGTNQYYVKHYLYYDNTTASWKYVKEEGFTITNADYSIYMGIDEHLTITDNVPSWGTPTLTKQSSTTGYIWYKTVVSGNIWQVYTLVGDTLYYLATGNKADGTINPNNRVRVTLTSTIPVANIQKHPNKDTFRLFETASYLEMLLTYDNNEWIFFPQSYGAIYTTIGSTTYYLGIDMVNNTLSSSYGDGSDPYWYSRWYDVVLGSSGKLQALLNNGNYVYLVTDADGNLSFSSTNSQKWYKDSSNNGIYTPLNGVNYYLNYSTTKGKWVAAAAMYYTIKSGSTYMAAASATTIKGSSSATETMWYLSGSKLYTMYSGSKVYLRWTASEGFSLTSTEANGTSFNVTTSGQSITALTVSHTIAGGTFTFYIVYQNNTWNVIGQKQSYLSRACANGSTYYLSRSGTSLTASTTSFSWYFSDTTNLCGVICTTEAGKVYHIYQNGTSVSLSTTSATSWYKYDSFYLTDNSDGKKYTLSIKDLNTNNYSALATPEVECNIVNRYFLSYKSGSTTYYLYQGSSSSFSYRTSKPDGSNTNLILYMDTQTNSRMGFYYQGTQYYFTATPGSSSKYSNISLTTSTSSARTWTYDSSTGYFTMSYSSKTWYLYFSGSTGKVYREDQTNKTSFTLEPAIFNDYKKNGIDSTQFGTSATTNSNTLTVSVAGTTPQAVNYKFTSLNCLKYYQTRSTTLPTGQFSSKKIDGITPIVVYASYNITPIYVSAFTSKTSDMPSQLLITIEPSAIATTTTLSNPKITYVSTIEELYICAQNVSYRRGTYIALRSELQDENTPGSYYSDYRADIRNTGYIVGGTYSNPSGSGQGDIRVSAYSIRNIRGSYSNGTLSTLYTFNDSGTTPVAINESSNTYTQYETTKETLLQMLGSSSSYVYGLHFMDAAITTSHVINAEAVMIQNKSYVNYELPESCIDFHVYSQGYIVLYAGDYYTSGNSCFFSLHQVIRDSSKHITEIREISEIYAKPNHTEKDNYLYKYSDGTWSKGDGTTNVVSSKPSGYSDTPIFKMSWLTNPSNGRDFSYDYIYYFEIPVNAGEFALGSVSGQDGGYLLYLDIASNGKQASNFNTMADIKQDPLFTQIDNISYGKTINLPFNFSYSIPTGSNETNFSVSISLDQNTKIYDPEWNCDCLVYVLTIVNRTGKDMDLSVLLVDNDDDPDNAYPIKYKIYYNGSEYQAGDAYDSSLGVYYATSSYLLKSS